MIVKNYVTKKNIVKNDDKIVGFRIENTHREIMFNQIILEDFLLCESKQRIGGINSFFYECKILVSNEKQIDVIVDWYIMNEILNNAFVNSFSNTGKEVDIQMIFYSTSPYKNIMSIEIDGKKMSYINFYKGKFFDIKINVKTKIDKILSFFPLLSLIFLFLLMNKVPQEFILTVNTGLLISTSLVGFITCYLPVYIAHKRLYKYLSVFHVTKFFFSEFSHFRKTIIINYVIAILFMLLTLWIGEYF